MFEIIVRFRVLVLLVAALITAAFATQIPKLQREMTGLMVRTFEDAFRENPMPEEVRRVAAELRREGEVLWGGIDLLASDALEMEQALLHAVGARLTTRFQGFGMESYTTAFV